MALTTVRPQGMGFNTGRRNLIINGAMQVSQRGTDFNDVANGTYTIDRFKLGKNNTDNAVINIDQVTTSPDGFSNSLKISVGTAESALAADESLLLQHLIEAQNLQHLQNGSSGAQSVTLSFWVRSDKTGTYTVAIRKPDNTDRNQSKEYTISAANTWEHKSLTFSGDTSGGGITNDNGAGFFCDWWLAGGSNFTGGTMDTWANTATQRLSTNQVNLMDGTNEWYITGIQLEVGENASDFEHRSFGEELSLCQRYFCKSFDTGVTPGTAAAGGAIRGVRGDGSFITNLFFPQEMRAAPTVTMYSPTTGASGKVRNLSGSGSDEASAAFSQGTRNAGFTFTSTSTEVCVNAHFTAEAEL
jgi:hypothetical protein